MGDSEPGRSPARHEGAPRRAPEVSVAVVRRSERWREALGDEDLLRRAAVAAVAMAAPDLPAECEVAVVLTSDDEVRGLNRDWRDRDRPTNVLSFPLVAPGASGPLGDVVLAAETVQREAEELGRPVAQHAAHLVVHGVLHLLGHDHMSDDEAARMEALEARILATLGIADPYDMPAEATAPW